MPCDAEAMGRIRKLISANKGGLRAVFCYGNPDGKDIDICVVCDEPSSVPVAKPPIDQVVYDDRRFRAMLKQHGKSAKEFRIYYGSKYVLTVLDELVLEGIEIYDLIP
ncbi:MAG: hypothetical protein QXU82_03210 [Candidatus Aenigmatarchaeota archaeon]